MPDQAFRGYTLTYLAGLHVEDLGHLFSAVFDVRHLLDLEPGCALDLLLNAVLKDIALIGYSGPHPDLFEALGVQGGLHEAPRAKDTTT